MAAVKRKKKKVFNVFEAGSGEHPIGLVLQAEKAKTRNLRLRKFTGVDQKRVNLNNVLEKMGISRTPKNLRLMQGCAVKALKSLSQTAKTLFFQALS